MSQESPETIGPNVDIPATTESNAFQHERLLFPSQRAEERYVFAQTYDPKVLTIRSSTAAAVATLHTPIIERAMQHLRSEPQPPSNGIRRLSGWRQGLRLCGCWLARHTRVRDRGW